MPHVRISLVASILKYVNIVIIITYNIQPKETKCKCNCILFTLHTNTPQDELSLCSECGTVTRLHLETLQPLFLMKALQDNNSHKLRQQTKGMRIQVSEIKIGGQMFFVKCSIYFTTYCKLIFIYIFQIVQKVIFLNTQWCQGTLQFCLVSLPWNPKRWFLFGKDTLPGIHHTISLHVNRESYQ